jgi:hypothetical protein
MIALSALADLLRQVLKDRAASNAPAIRTPAGPEGRWGSPDKPNRAYRWTMDIIFRGHVDELVPGETAMVENI